MMITVFTPTYNRADLIHRVFDSLQKQGFRDFEWIVVDDGSTDDTHKILESFHETATFPIKVHRQTNQGKVAAINRGLTMAEGELFICFDSDDWCTPDAFATIAKQWEALGPEGRKAYCGISCLKVLPDQSMVGEDYTRMRTLGESYVDRFNRRIKGDKWEILRTDLHREALYELAPGERYMAPEYAWLKMGSTHKTVFLNEALSIVEYQVGGISLNNLAHRASSPVSAMRYYQLAFRVSDNWITRFRSSINLVRFAYHAQRASDLPSVMRMMSAVPGWLLYQKDMESLKERRRQGVK
ncbi:glycosyltransferase family 2 protein [Tritonibacter mobilis]|uniref:glycosyltransferase family 2 protein n=1 Tax=Tritonibacter mobilis TaxID=379347 RepID=UPI000E0DC096|nr:glycosyltransferase family 2 protein [Tritonibacter mobilis]